MLGEEKEIATGVTRAVAARDDGLIEFWTTHFDTDGLNEKRRFFIVVTGHPILAEWRWEGTTARTPLGGYVGHLMSRKV